MSRLQFVSSVAGTDFPPPPAGLRTIPGFGVPPHVPAVADGLISVVAALCAVRLCPAARDAIFLSHASKEPGYRRAAEELGLAPFLQLGMRLGEGSGCPLAFQVLDAACAVINDMATFDEAGINDDYLDEIRRGDQFTP